MQKLTNLIVDHPAGFGLTLAVVIVVLGLFVYGLGDVLKFTPKRVWAISGVVFRESIRRKVLWLTPIVMLAIGALGGIQRPEDASDAIRQTIQFSLFASGLLVVISGVMLACTNLPRDIDTKVIFTIVTKPTTRLEIVLGKIIGFARVTGSILILMGLFTYAYTSLRAWTLSREIAAVINQTENEFARERLMHQQREGLLETRRLAVAESLDMFARPPTEDAPVRWASVDQSAMFRFQTIPADFVSNGAASGDPGAGGMRLVITMTADQVGKIEIPQPELRGPMLPDPDRAAYPYGKPAVLVSVMEANTEVEIIPSQALNGGRPYEFLATPERSGTITVELDATAASTLSNVRDWVVAVSPTSDNFLIGFEPGAVRAVIPGAGGEDRAIAAFAPTDPHQWAFAVRGGAGRGGRMLNGPTENRPELAVAVARFRDVPVTPNQRGTVGVELFMDIERLDDVGEEEATQIEIVVRRADGSNETPPLYVTPEKLKIVYADIPASAFATGDFDVVLRTLTPGHAITLTPASIGIVQSRHSFGLNLAAAVFKQWMLSILVVTIGTFASTFLSWPLAIVTSVVALMGRWAVNQVSDSLQPGIGATLATDIGATNATQARVISSTFDGLARLLNFVSQFLPDIDSFSAIDLVQRGHVIPYASIGGAATILAMFVLPLLALSYIIFRRKEVAP